MIVGFIKAIKISIRYKTNMRNTCINLSSIITLSERFHGYKFALNLFG